MVRYLQALLLTTILTSCDGNPSIATLEQAVKPTAKLDCYSQCKADCHDSKDKCLRDCKRLCRSENGDSVFTTSSAPELSQSPEPAPEPAPVVVAPVIPQAHYVMGHTYPKGAILDRKGRIVIVGYYMTGVSDSLGWQDQIFTMRLLSNGDRDNTFGNNGVVNIRVPITAYGNNAGFVVIENDNGYWVSGNFSGVKHDGRIKDVFWTHIGYDSTQTGFGSLDLGYDEAVYAGSLDAEGFTLVGARSNGFIERLTLRVLSTGAMASVQTDAAQLPLPVSKAPFSLVRLDGSIVIVGTIIVDGRLAISISGDGR